MLPCQMRPLASHASLSDAAPVLSVQLDGRLEGVQQLSTAHSQLQALQAEVGQLQKELQAVQEELEAAGAARDSWKVGK